MATYKVVDVDQLDADLSVVADAIREKGGTSDQMVFPDGFVSAVEPLVNKHDYLVALCNGTVTEVISDEVTRINKDFQRNNSSLVTVDLPKVTELHENAFNGCTSLVNFSMPGVKTVGSMAFYEALIEQLYFPNFSAFTGWGYNINNLHQLKRVYLGSCSKIMTYSFATCTSLKTLVIDGNTVATLDNVNAFSKTPISETDGGLGYIYVRAALVNSYKTATNWVTYANQIRAIEDYPEVLEGWE